jgi:hypothetical protein
VVEAVLDALAGKLSSTAVNAPMVSPEVLRELQPYIALAEGLGKAAVSLVAEKVGAVGWGMACCSGCCVVWPVWLADSSAATAKMCDGVMQACCCAMC